MHFATDGLYLCEFGPSVFCGTVDVGRDGHAHGAQNVENTALMYAVGNCRADCVRLLLDAGADKEAKNYVRRVGSPFSLFY